LFVCIFFILSISTISPTHKGVSHIETLVLYPLSFWSTFLDSWASLVHHLSFVHSYFPCDLGVFETFRGLFRLSRIWKEPLEVLQSVCQLMSHESCRKRLESLGYLQLLEAVESRTSSSKPGFERFPDRQLFQISASKLPSPSSTPLKILKEQDHTPSTVVQQSPNTVKR